MKVILVTSWGPEVQCGIAFRIQALNDRRALLIEQLTRDAGEGDLKEKL